MTAINHQNNFGTNLTSGTSSGATTSPLNSIPTIDAPFYLAFDATNINSHYEVLQITSKTATNVNHAALTYDHTTAEEVRCVCPAVEMDTWSAALNTTTWTDWTPTFENFTKGSATVVAKYTQIGKTVHFLLSVILNGSTMGTGPTFSLPVTAASTFPVATTLGQLYWLDEGTADGQGFISLASTTSASLRTYAGDATYGGYAPFSSTVPMTWANSDRFIARGTYEAA